MSAPTPQTIAKNRLTAFENSVAYYKLHRHELFDCSYKHTRIIANALKLCRNFTRIPRDIWHALVRRGKQGRLAGRHVTATVLDRDAFFHDQYLARLFSIPSNVRTLRSLLEYELYKEVNAEHFLMVEGLGIAQFHALMALLGCHTSTFLTDDRGENAGRLTLDNASIDLPLSLLSTDPDLESEQRLWGKIFRRLHVVPWIGAWGMSRTHSALYAARDQCGQDILFLPIHVDPNSPLVAIRHLLERLLGKVHQRSALAYHTIAFEGDSNYVGTGLYDLGIQIFLTLLAKAEQAHHIAGLSVHGESSLATSGSIVKDDRITWIIASLLRKSY